MTLDQIRDYCLSLPGTSEDLKWEGDICFLVAEKMFFITGAEPGSGGTFKADPEEFEELTERPGFIPAPYLARAKWVHVEDIRKLRPREGKELIKRSYDLVVAKLPKRVQKELAE